MSFPGTTSNVEKVLSEASVFAFPSLFEGFPLSLGEAMSKGLAVVGCQDCPGVNSLLKNGRNGLLVDPTPEAFSRALSCLMESADIRRKLGAQARIDVSAYCPDKVWEKWKYFIESVINNQK